MIWIFILGVFVGLILALIAEYIIMTTKGEVAEYSFTAFKE